MSDEGLAPAPVPLAVRAKQAAKLLSLSERTLWSWTNAGRIKHVRAGRIILYRLCDLEEFLAERTRGNGHA